jgi:hypothetical protein
MVTGALALCFASALAGAGLYLNFVEQPARLALDDAALLAEWAPSDRRGNALLAGLALLAAAAGLAAFSEGGDLRQLGGGLLALLTWPYSLFAMAPLNNQILALAPRDVGAARVLVRQWGVLELGQTALAVAATALLLWAL